MFPCFAIVVGIADVVAGVVFPAPVARGAVGIIHAGGVARVVLAGETRKAVTVARAISREAITVVTHLPRSTLIVIGTGVVAGIGSARGTPVTVSGIAVTVC